MIKYLFSFFVFPSLLLFFPLSTGAHGLGQSFEQEVGEYLVEFEYETLEVVSNEAAPYVFRLLNNETGEPVAFDAVLARMVSAETNETVLVSRLEEDDFLTGVARLTMLLPEGDYTVEMSFQNEEGDTFVEAQFEHVVLAGENGFDWVPIVALVGGLVLGMLGSRFLGSSNKEDGGKKDKKTK